MGGRILTTLKTGETKSASHEAKLGILVISILVFAFGFLVYHKMDMRQRQLTEAAIKSNGVAPPEKPEFGAADALLSATTKASATDPLANIVDLGDDSPFAETELTLTEPVTERPSGKDSFVAFDEDSRSNHRPIQGSVISPEPEFTFNDRSQPALAPEEAIPDFTLAATDFETGAAESSKQMQETSLPAVAEIGKSAAIAIVEETFPAPDYLTDDVQYFPAGPEFKLTNQFERAATSPDSLQAARDAKIELAVEEPAFPALRLEVAADQANQELTLPLIEERLPEPVLLAMAEPQQANGFDNGFLIDDGTAPAKAPLDEPSIFPAFEPDQAETFQSTSTATHKPSTDSRGFNAVANPGKRSDRSAFRTAAGSGSDGKFSLAAFNYGDHVAPAAPDDGSTFESVVVQNGDNYTKISKRVYGTVRYFSALAVFNQHRIAEPKNMRPGMVVLVPAKEVLEERYPELFADSQPKVVQQAGFLVLDDGSPAYRVGERETISEISQRFLGRSSRWIEIYRLNQSTLSDPNKLKPGSILALPADAVEVNMVP